jgi:hypothetical protein
MLELCLCFLGQIRIRPLYLEEQSTKHQAQSTKFQAQSTKYKVPSTKLKAQSTKLKTRRGNNATPSRAVV